MPEKQRGEYLQKNLAFGHLSATVAKGVLIFGGCIGLVLLGVAYSVVGATPMLLALVLLVLLGEGWLILQVWPAFAKSRQYAGRFSQGILGEDAVWKILYALPSGYTVFANILLPNGRGDIDFVVTGPNGIYTVEAKNFSGTVSVDGGQLYINGHLPYKNVLGQAGGEAKSLSDFLFGSIGQKVYVTSVVAIAGATDIQRPVQAGRVWVSPVGALPAFIANNRGVINPSALQSINNVLRLMTQK